MKKTISNSSIIIVIFLLLSFIRYAPSSQDTIFRSINKKNGLPSYLSIERPLHKIERWEKERAEYGEMEGELKKIERDLGKINVKDGETRISGTNVDLVGLLPYGPCYASAIDPTRNIVLIGNGETVQVLDISTPSTPSKIGEIYISYEPRDIVISGNYPYVLTQGYLKIVDISNLSSPALIGETTYIGSGYKIEVKSNYAYVAAGSGGLRIFDISNPSNPSYIGKYDPSNNYVYDVGIWNNYAFILNFDYYDDIYELRIIDVSTPSSPALVGTYYVAYDWDYFYITSVEATSTGYACITAWEDYGGGEYYGRLQIVDVVSNPSNPTEVAYYESFTCFEDCMVSGDYAYVYDFESDTRSVWNNHLKVINISDPTTPFYVGECDAPSDWFYELDVSGNYVSMTHLPDGISLYDVGDRTNPFQTSSYDTPSMGVSHGNSIAVSGDFVYMVSYQEGLRVMDISDPTNPSEAGSYDFPGSHYGIAVSGNYAYVASVYDMFIVDVFSPSNPTQAGYLDLAPYIIYDVAVSGNYAYASGHTWSNGDYYACLCVIDVSYPGGPSLVGTYICPDYDTRSWGGIIISGNYAYVGIYEWDGYAALIILDISDPSNPTEVGSYKSSDGGWTDDVAVRGNYAFLVGDNFRVIDVSNPSNPFEIFGQYDQGEGIELSGNYAYFSESGRLKIYDISDPYNPTEVGSYYNGMDWGLDVNGNYAYQGGSFYVFKNTLAPEVSITSPSEWSVLSGSVTIEAQASHSSGIGSVEFYIDDVLKSTEMSSPYTYVWDTSSASQGSHKIRARAYNNNGTCSDAEIEVYIRNSFNLCVYSQVGGTTDPEPGSYSYTINTPPSQVTISAINNSGYNFSGWTGTVPAGHENDNPLTLTIDSDKSITATFSIIVGNYKLTINESPTGEGTTDPVPGTYSYPPGSEVSITANPESGHSFIYWTGDVPEGHETDNPLTIMIDSNKSIIPHFSYEEKTWTFMVYLDGDNNLEDAAIDDFLEMASVGSEQNINIVVQFDRIDGYDSRFGDWTTTKRFYVTNGMTPSAENAIRHMGELNQGDPQTLADFIGWARMTFPATNYALVLWNHGGGWRKSKKEQLKARLEVKSQKKKVETILKAVCWDETDGYDRLNMNEVQTAFSSSGGADLIGFDACLMGMVEVAYEIRDYGQVMVGSEDIEPWGGWPYDRILSDLASNPTWSASDLGKAVVNRYYESYDPVYYTQAAIDLTNMEALSIAINTFAQNLMDYWDSDEVAVRNAALDVMTEIDNTVIHENHGPYWIQANGLAVYFPETDAEFDGYYNDIVIDFASDTKWDEFLLEFYNSMEGSWIAKRRTYSQQFLVDQHIDLHHFCNLLRSYPEDKYTESQISHEFVGGGTAQGFQSDEDYLTYNLPFSFPYYEEIIPSGTEIYISDNGFIDFENAPLWSYENSPSGLVVNKRIAPCWVDLRTDGIAQEGEDVYITVNTDNIVIRWVAESYYYADPVNVELILYDDGRIQSNYGGNDNLQGWLDKPTIGISKGDGLKFNFSVYDGEQVLTNVDSELFTPGLIDNPPSVSILSPLDGDTVSGKLTIRGSAIDDQDVNKVEFYLDGELESTDESSPYTYDWDTTVYSKCFGDEDDGENGVHTVKLIAYDNSDQTGEKEISVIVSNPTTLALGCGMGGTIDIEPGSYSCECKEQFTIEATPESDYRFVGWSGDIHQEKEEDNPITIIVDSDKWIVANFIRQYTLTINSESGGSTNPSPGSYTHDAEIPVAIEAIADSGYKFSGWSGDASGTTNPITIKMTSDKSIKANFEEIKEEEEEEGKKKGPCFIATAAYSSPQHPHVEILRGFRDAYLMPNKVGRALVNLYYKYSPFVANLIAKHKVLKVMVRASLMPLVAFSYSMVHLGLLFTAFMLAFIFTFPVFFIRFCQRRVRICRSKIRKAK